MNRALVFGGTGQLGECVLRTWKGIELKAPSSADVDVRDGDRVRRAIERWRPDIVVNASGYNDVPGAETNISEAMAVNADAVEAMAIYAAQLNAAFLTVSSDYVFDGLARKPYVETDATNPLNAYGRSKRAGEIAALAANPKSYVVRTCGLYGIVASSSKGYNFIGRVLDQARQGEDVIVVNDQTVSPTYAADLSNALLFLLERRAPFGIYHGANAGAVTWYEFAREALHQAGLGASVRAVLTNDTVVRRPRFSALDNEKFRSLGIEMPSWKQGISSYLKESGHARGGFH